MASAEGIEQARRKHVHPVKDSGFPDDSLHAW